MTTFKNEAAIADLQILIDQVVAKTLEAVGINAASANEIRASQLKLRGYEIADVLRRDQIAPHMQALRAAIAASPAPIAAAAGKFSPADLLAIFEARAEAQLIAGADLKTALKSGDELANLKKLMASKDQPLILDQCDRLMAVTGLLYG